MKKAEQFAYQSCFEISVMNKELVKRLRESPPEYDPATAPSIPTSPNVIPDSDIKIPPVTDPSVLSFVQIAPSDWFKTTTRQQMKKMLINSSRNLRS